MLLRFFAEDVSYLIEVPEGSRVERLSHLLGSAGHFLADRLIIPWAGGEIPIPTEPPAVLAILAREGHYGMRLRASAPLGGPRGTRSIARR
jgi:hypothetical protein